MSRLPRIFSIAALLMLCLFTLSCDDGDRGCTNYFLTEVTPENGLVEKLYYNDDGLLDVFIKIVPNSSPRRDEYTYNDNRQLIRVDVGDGLGYNEFSYDDDGHLELIRVYGTSAGSLYREVKYSYSIGGKLSSRDIYNDGRWVYHELYEYPGDNIIELQSFMPKDDGTFGQPLLAYYTLDNNPMPYPDEYYAASEAWGSFSTPNNIVSYQQVDEGVAGATQAYSYKYNEGGYPVSVARVATYTYSCEPVKEP